MFFRQLAGQSAEQIATLQGTIGTDSSGSLKKHLDLQKSPGIMVWERFVPSITIALSSCSRANFESERGGQLVDAPAAPLEQVIEVPPWPCVVSLSGAGAESNSWALASVARAGPCVSPRCSGVPMTLCDEDTLTVPLWPKAQTG